MSLGIDYFDIRRHLGRQLGWGRDFDVWDDSNRMDFPDIVKRGLKWFYYPHTIPGQRLSHRWTFLRPVYPIDLAASIHEYELPDECDGTIDSVQWSGDTTTWSGINFTSLERVQKYQNESPGHTGTPQWCAINKHRGEGEQIQKKSLVFHPIPDQSYQIRAVIGIAPQTLTEDRPHPWGGDAHGDTILAACEAAAESILNDGESEKFNLFLTALQSSISLDKHDIPRTLGYCGNPEKHGFAYDRAGSLSYNPFDE